MTIGGQDDTGDPLLELTADPEAAALLRGNLTEIAAQHRGTAMGRVVADVLAGRRPPGDLHSDPAFMALTRTGVRDYTDYLSSLPVEERRRLVAEAQQIADVPD